MLFSDRPRTHYEKPLAHEVICQLRFPTILTIKQIRSLPIFRRLSGRTSPVRPPTGPTAAPGW